MIKDTTKVLEGVADESWVPWAGRLIPNVVCRVRAAVEARAQEEHDRKVREEVKQLVKEKLARAAKRDRRLEEKLTAVLEGRRVRRHWRSIQRQRRWGIQREARPLGQKSLG